MWEVLENIHPQKLTHPTRPTLQGSTSNVRYQILVKSYFCSQTWNNRNFVKVIVFWNSLCEWKVRNCCVSIFSVLGNFFSGLQDKMSDRPSMLCWTFWFPARHFSQLMTGIYWTLPDKMSGNVVAVCRTSAKVCRTCPACPPYFARTEIFLLFGLFEIELPRRFNVLEYR